MLRSCVAEVWPFVAPTLKVDVPAVVGVPVIAPVEEFRVRPAGSAPLTIDQVTPETFDEMLAL